MFLGTSTTFENFTHFKPSFATPTKLHIQWFILTNLKPHVEHSNGFAAEITLETHYFHTLRLMSSRLSKSPFYKSWTQISCTTSSERTMLEVSTQIRQNHIAEYEYGQMQENNSSKISFLHGLGSNWYEIWQMSDRMYFTCLF